MGGVTGTDTIASTRQPPRLATTAHTQAPRLSIDYVIVAYRSEGDISACLDAIALDRGGWDDVIVVDNASPDGSGETALAHALKPRVIRSERNLGFGGACNLAAAQSDAELLFLINPDARIRAGTTARLQAILAADSAIVAAGPRVLGPGGASGAESAGFEPSVRSALGHFLLLARIPGIGRWFPPLQLPAGRGPQRVDWVSGAAMMVRSDAYRAVDGFDASMFLYMEDVDLCRRLREAGGQIAYEPLVVVDHDLGGSQGSEQPRRWFLAFHAYVARQRGEAVARVVSAIAAAGFAGRWAILSIRDRARSRTMTQAALVAARCAALGGSTGDTPR
jgi:GT2 family glycosyltransferase